MLVEVVVVKGLGFPKNGMSFVEVVAVCGVSELISPMIFLVSGLWWNFL